MKKRQGLAPGVSTTERGAELVEFALISPLFLLLLMGIIEFGRGYNVYENVIHATREGVRAASADCLTNGNCAPGNPSKLSDSQIRSKIREHLQAININVPDSDIIIDNGTPLTVGGFKTPSGPAFSRQVPVYNIRVNYSYNFLFLNKVIKLVVPSSAVGGSGVVISATVEMMDEASSPT
jgi:hypothetical protein